MLHQDGRGGLFETCARRGTGIICYGPLGFGLLTGAVTAETDFGDDDWRAGGHGISVYQEMFAPGRLEANLGLVDSLRPMAARLAVTLGQLVSRL